MSPELVSSYIVAFGTIVGVVIGSLVSFFIAKLQFKATVISANRQHWINTLRDYIAEFQVKAKIVSVESKLSTQKGTSFAANPKNFDESIEGARVIVNKVALLINPNEPDHEKLLSLMKELENLCINGNPSDDENHDRLQNEITSIGQKILKREWERVKRGK